MFDPSAPHIIVLLIVVLLLFGSRRLPGAAKSLGESMHIFKKSVSGLDANGKPLDGSGAQAQGQGPAGVQQQAALPQSVAPQLGTQPQAFDAVTQQQQMADLQRQIQELQRQNAGADGSPAPGAGAPLSEAQRSQQPF
jgi:sec-independent protein translocase protein TatA